MNAQGQRVDVLAWIAEASKAIDVAYGPQAQLPKEAPFVSSAFSDLIGFVSDAECKCRPENEHYAEHICCRCELLARVGGAQS